MTPTYFRGALSGFCLAGAVALASSAAAEPVQSGESTHVDVGATVVPMASLTQSDSGVFVLCDANGCVVQQPSDDGIIIVSY